jgi:hypothetical protein
MRLRTPRQRHKIIVKEESKIQLEWGEWSQIGDSDINSSYLHIFETFLFVYNSYTYNVIPSIVFPVPKIATFSFIFKIIHVSYFLKVNF